MKEFEIARLAMVRAAKTGEIDPARGLAWSHRIHPLSSRDLEDAFKDDFKIRQADVEEILEMIDHGWRNKKLVSFYEVESALIGQRIGRMDIYFVCRAAFLDRRFNEDVWKALTVAGSGPIETQGMTEPFNVDDDIDY